LDRQSNASSTSQVSYSSENCLSSIPTSPETMYSPKYEYPNNNLTTQQYDSSLPGHYSQSENVRYTPSYLGWTHGTELLKLYTFVVPKGQDPYLELGNWTPTYETPLRVYLDQPTRVEKNKFPCQYPGPCNGKQNVFGRPADLERHYKNVHADEKDKYPCSYHKCPRSQEVFTRKDHYRDHLKDFHKEDIGCAKGEKLAKDKDKRKWQQSQIKWLAERNISPKHWRCPRCLVNNVVAKVGWECMKCHVPCEEDRIRAREKLALEEPRATDDTNGAVMGEIPQYAATGFYNCGACNDYKCIDDGFGGWIECTSCQSSAGPAYVFDNAQY